MNRAACEKEAMIPTKTEGALTRRSFLGTVAGAAALGQTISMGAAEQQLRTPKRPLIVSTWPFGKPANEDALRAFDKGGTALDAVEQGIWNPEADENNSSVG